MKFETYLKTRQPVIYQTLCNASEGARLSHAYLVLGESGTPLKEMGRFLAKTILCDHPHPLADEECTLCHRVEVNDYPDLVEIDGSENSIKKGDVETVVASFHQTPLENKGIMVYFIHMAENMTADAANSLLKFLEEPTPYSYAILTSQNEEKLLPTIKSRCEILRLRMSSRQIGYEEAISAGVPTEDAELLSYFFNDGFSIGKKKEETSYQNAKEALQKALDSLANNASNARFVFQKDIAKLCADKATTRLFFDFLTLSFKDIVGQDSNQAPLLPSYVTIIQEAAKNLPHHELSLLQTMTLRREIESNINTGLLLTHLVSVLTKE